MTPKQKVLRVYPKAESYEWGGTGARWCIYSGTSRVRRGVHSYSVLNITLNVADNTAQQAWAAAAKHPTVRRVGDGGSK